LGGLKAGFASVGYQVFTEWAVKKAPMVPITSGIAMLMIKAKGLNFIDELYKSGM
jgi:hypothetical protein